MVDGLGACLMTMTVNIECYKIKLHPLTKKVNKAAMSAMAI